MSDTPEFDKLVDKQTGNAVPVQTPDQMSFLAQSKKAVAGGIVAGATAFSGALTSALNDGAVNGGDLWLIVGAIVGGFAVGFAGVWVAPPNASKA